MYTHQHVDNRGSGVGIQNNLTIQAPKILPSHIFSIWNQQPFIVFLLKLTPGFLLVIYYVNNLHQLDFGLLILCTLSVYTNFFLLIYFAVSKNAKILTYQTSEFFELDGELLDPTDFILDITASKGKKVVLKHKIDAYTLPISFIFKNDFWIIKGKKSFIAWFFDQQKKYNESARDST